MDSVTNENTIDASLDLSDHLGDLVRKEEQKLAVETLLLGKDVMAVLPTGFGKSIIYISRLRSGKKFGSFIVHLGCCPASKYYPRSVTIQ